MQKKMFQKEYIDISTGDIETMNVISANGDYNFEKIWLGYCLEAIEVIGNQKIKVVNYLIKYRNKSDNTILLSQRELAKKCEVSLQTVNSTIKALKSSNFLREVKNGIYQINPDCIFKGNKDKRLNILLQYNQQE